ncbi:MAG: tetraacyldisaccharide 4'-kinase, partial [Halieaceae bacterium]
WLWLLRPIEFLFRLLSATRRAAYKHGLLKAWRAPVPVVVVGNITVGGTGKTPVVIALVEHLQQAGLRPGVVSRGYGASSTQFPHTVNSASTAADCGDEPLLIHLRTGCPCVVSPDRPAAVRQLLAEFPVDVVLSDDGLQHYRLYRDVEIAVLDASRGIGNGFCLPAGPLREPVARLAQVHHVLKRGSDDLSDGVRYRAQALVNVVSNEQKALDASEGPAVVSAVAGIGQPAQFFGTLLAAGYVVQENVFADHHAYTADDFSDLQDAFVIMTEKDAVKCRRLVGDNTWYLKIEAELPRAVIEAVTLLAQTQQQETP